VGLVPSSRHPIGDIVNNATLLRLTHASVAKRQYILNGDRTVKALKAKLTDSYSLDVLLNLREYAR